LGYRELCVKKTTYFLLSSSPPVTFHLLTSKRVARRVSVCVGRRVQLDVRHTELTTGQWWLLQLVSARAWSHGVRDCILGSTRKSREILDSEFRADFAQRLNVSVQSVTHSVQLRCYACLHSLRISHEVFLSTQQSVVLQNLINARSSNKQDEKANN